MIKEIAKELHLSPTTVSVCLSHREGDPRYCIRPEKARMVREYAAAHGYVPDMAARQLRTGTGTPPVGVIFSESSGLEKFSLSFRQSLHMLSEHGRDYHVMGYGSRKLSQCLGKLKGMRVREVIAFSSLSEPCPVHFPAMFRKENAKDAHSVQEYLDDWKACETLLQDMTLYVIDYCFPKPEAGGIRRGMVRMGADLLDFIPHVLGKIKEAGLGPVATVPWSGNEATFVPHLLDTPEYIFPVTFGGSRFEEGRRIARHALELLRRKPLRTIFLGNDEMAAGAIAELDDMGVSVPDDIAVLGWGNAEFSSCTRVPLSTFRCFTDEFTALTLHAILDRTPPPLEICRPYEYVQRASFQLPKGMTM